MAPGNTLDQIVRQVMGQWTDQDYAAAFEVKKTMETPGWKVIQGLWDDLDTAIRTRMRKEANRDTAFKLIGVQEGFDITREIPYKVLMEKEEQEKSRQAIEKEKVGGWVEEDAT